MSAFEDSFPASLGPNDGNRADEAATFAAHFRALRRLYSSFEHLLNSPLNSIGLNVELLAAETSDLQRQVDRGDAVGVRPGETFVPVLSALRAGYGRLVESSATALDLLPAATRREEEVDLVRLLRRLSTLGGTESILLRATWSFELPPHPVPVRARRDLLAPALLSLLCRGLAEAGAGSRMALSLNADPAEAKIRLTVEPRRPSGGEGEAERLCADLGELARRLGGECRESAGSDVFQIDFSLPRYPGAAAC